MKRKLAIFATLCSLVAFALSSSVSLAAPTHFHDGATAVNGAYEQFGITCSDDTAVNGAYVQYGIDLC